MKDTISFEDFLKLDLRVGEIKSVSVPEWSKKLLEMRVDFGGKIGERTVMAGVRQWYGPEDFEGKKGVFLVNLEPKRMGEGESCGMMLMSDAKSGPKPVFVGSGVEVGTVVR